MPIPTNPFDLAPHTAPRAADLNTIFHRLYGALDKEQVGLGTDNFKAHAFTTPKFPDAEDWQLLPITGLQVLPFPPPMMRYYKDQIGIVHLDPTALTGTGSTVPANTLLGTFPAGYRPGLVASVFVSFWAVTVETPLLASIESTGAMRTSSGGGSGGGGGLFHGNYVPNGSWLAEG